MTSVQLLELLGLPGKGQQLRDAIRVPLREFRRGKSERGRSTPVQIQSVGRNIPVSAKHVANLCSFYFGGEIDEVELEYAASLLDLCPDFVFDETVKDAIFQLASPEINGGLSRDRVGEIVNSLNLAS